MAASPNFSQSGRSSGVTNPAMVKLHSTMLAYPCFGFWYGSFQPCRTSHGRIGNRSGECLKGWIEGSVCDGGSAANAATLKKRTSSARAAWCWLWSKDCISFPLLLKWAGTKPLRLYQHRQYRSPASQKQPPRCVGPFCLADGRSGRVAELDRLVPEDTAQAEVDHDWPVFLSSLLTVAQQSGHFKLIFRPNCSFPAQHVTWNMAMTWPSASFQAVTASGVGSAWTVQPWSWK